MNETVDITLQVKTLTWQEVGKGAIFTGDVLDADYNPTGDEETVRADYNAVGRETFVGKKEIWRIVGHWETYNGKPQIGAKQAFLIRPTGEHIVNLLANNPMFEGLGDAYANRLWKNHGTDLNDMLNKGDLPALTEAMVKAEVRQPEKVAHTAILVWKELGVNEVISWLDSLPADKKMGVLMGRKMYGCWGEKAKQYVMDDPYRLLAFTGWYEGRRAWKVVDNIAQTVFEVGVDDKRRFHASIIESLHYMYEERSTIVDRATLLDEMSRRLGGKKLAERALKEVAGSKAFLTNDSFWQARGAFLMEKYVAEGLLKLARYRQYELFGPDIQRVERIQAVISEFEGKEGYALGERQKEAVQTILENQVTIITGGAGVGKTTVLKCVHECVEDAGGRVIQMALSGRASRRMAEATNRPAITIAGFLKKKQNFDGCPTIIIDEASMLDLPLTYRIIKKVPEGCRLVIVGDPEQLAPIGPGKVFHVLTKDVKDLFPVVVLNKIYRQDGASGIPAVSDAIRYGKWPELPLYDGKKGVGVSIIPADPDDMLGGFDEDGVYQNGILENLYEELGGNEEDVQLLSATTKSDPFSTGGINDAFHAKYSVGNRPVLKWLDHLDDFLTKWVDAGYSEGDKVVFKYNDWERELFNGSLGKITKAYSSESDPAPEEDDPCMEVDFDTGVQELDAADLASLMLAYSITVHKAQGSQFERVIIPVRKADNLDRSMIYTAITRGVSQVVLVGDIEAAENAVRSVPSVDERQVGLGHLLKYIVSADTLPAGGNNEPESRGYDPPDEGQCSKSQTTCKGAA